MSMEMNKALVEQAGGDERAAFEQWLEQHMSHHFSPEFDLAKYEDSGEYRYNPAADYWKAWQARAALAQPSPVQAEAERPEVVGVRYEDGTILSAEDCGIALEVCARVQTPLMTVAQHERIVEARWNRAMDLLLDHVSRISEKFKAERDAALARVEQQERTIAGMNEAHAKLAGLYEAAQAQHSVPVPVVTPEMVMAAMAVFRLDVSPFKSMEAALIAALRKAAAPGKEGV
ncbi:hypothetical protein [Pseudomonas aeruginosa]|uniref:hypothetical protein n=1 Tax=Pseudomonas aeruginosa TaxID=287 RepID=UPI001BAD21AF|nr:hypothetical protein [Pseudomonas aeruginosa]QUI41145.1 hypothetical protein I3251_03005 [Pseudomonas aeruginosa]QUI49225.1 hypothetical protein JBL36_23765 [Pseudomonas aeruginosa]QUI58909.1 hypothetical protein JBL37_11075 [Pseudomonas aeruginosa]